MLMLMLMVGGEQFLPLMVILVFLRKSPINGLASMCRMCTNARFHMAQLSSSVLQEISDVLPQRYKGVAKVTTRRACKGFSPKCNPDSHWSAAFYKGLNSIQLKDGVDICVIIRDDAAGFRLDTLTTTKQYSTPSVKGSEILTRTDYVNKYLSTLQITSYNFAAMETTSEICAGSIL